MLMKYKSRVLENVVLAIGAVVALYFGIKLYKGINGREEAKPPVTDIAAPLSKDISPFYPKAVRPQVIKPFSEEMWLLIDKSDFALYVMYGNIEKRRYDIAVGKNKGQKLQPGDMRTPTGRFYVRQIQDSSAWKHDFGDGKGPIRGAYGPYFIRLDTGRWQGIGIHGTHDPGSIGTGATEGCIRLKNRDVKELRRIVKIGTPVLIRE